MTNAIEENSFFTQQVYENYNEEAFQVWKILYNRQKDVLTTRASQHFLAHIETLGFKAEKIPDFREVNKILEGLTGFEVVAVTGIIPDDLFFKLLAERKFPCSTWLRKMDQLDYLEEPDMFHDVYGHLPLLADIDYANFLEGLGELGVKYAKDEWGTHLLSRIYWYTIEFGLIKEDGANKIYGAGILSSSGESKYSLEEEGIKRSPFDIKAVLEASYAKDKFQTQYFILDSLETLYHSLPEAGLQIKTLLAAKI